MKHKVICLNLDTVKDKNKNQFRELSKYGYEYLCLGYRADQSHEPSGCEYTRYPRGLLRRLVFVFLTLLKNKAELSHVELYTGNGNFMVLEYLICRLLGINVCVVERGSPLLELDTSYGLIARYLRVLVYRNAKQVWIRELWMRDKLKSIGRDKFFFLSNAIEVGEEASHSYKKKIDFIWCNTFKSWRNIDWFIDSLSQDAFANRNAVILGLLEGNKTTNEANSYVKKYLPRNTILLPFQCPKQYYLDSRFFILPADIVFLNFSLLEAMSFGVVPIVSEVPGAAEIVEHGVNGILASHSAEGLAEAMVMALRLTEDEYERMSKNAREKVKAKFSIKSWGYELNDMYKGLMH